MTPKEALAEVVAAWPDDVPASPPLAAAAVAVAKLESSYGRGWRPPGDGSHNMGAITAGASWRGSTFSYSDSRPEGSRDVHYTTRFRVYPSRAEGWRDLVRLLSRMGVADVAARGPHAVAQRMYQRGYYTGLAVDSPAGRVDRYALGLRPTMAALGYHDGSGWVPPTAAILAGLAFAEILRRLVLR